MKRCEEGLFKSYFIIVSHTVNCMYRVLTIVCEITIIWRLFNCTDSVMFLKICKQQM
jgi:hypothetical protein